MTCLASCYETGFSILVFFDCSDSSCCWRGWLLLVGLFLHVVFSLQFKGLRLLFGEGVWALERGLLDHNLN